jgi:DNA polymerase-3 subunit chi
MAQIAFHILRGTDERARLKYACRLTERAYQAAELVFVALEDATQLQQFDELLWTFADRSFVPHEPYRDDTQWQETPVLLGCGQQPQQAFHLLVNLSSQIPAALALSQRVSEIVDADEPRRRAGRLRYRGYRDQGLNPETHNIAVEQAP